MTEPLAPSQRTSEFLSVREVAEFLNVSRLSVYRLIEQGLVPVYRILRCLRFKRTDLLTFLAGNRTAAWRTEAYASPKD